jgi:hypothetical protein
MGKMVSLFWLLFLLNSGKAAAQLRLRPISDSGYINFSIKVLPQNFYSQHLSFVCKKEVQLQKLTSLPIYIRVGSKDYVDYLEKKPNAINNRQ